ncbi:MAG: acetoin dehydrogenase dihydrolipoyllysine-residue acetyltransferase subunit [Thiotrichales bacterium]|nr:acetoin dehydrogenase dihydrolipoyllysine-residue acetyltransferase subunit [Thiotrichales bacterium]
MSDAGLIPLTMPKWGMAMETGKVVEWLIDEGGRVDKGDEILEVETEKIVNAMEANATGILSRRVARPGDELPVGALLGVISPVAVAADVIDSFISEFQSNFVPEESTGKDFSEPDKVTIGERTITYLRIPARDEQGKLPVIMIHGFGSDRNSWLFNIADLSENRTLYLLDLPGYGSSSKDAGDGSLGFFAGTITGFMDELDIDSAHLVGHSMGATIATTVAHAEPARVNSLVLISGGGVGETIDKGFISDFVSADRRRDMKPVLQKLFSNPALVTREMINEVLKFKRIEGVREELEKIVNGVFRGERVAVDYRDSIGELAMPVTFIWGSEDRIAVLDSEDEKPGNVTINRIADCGHVPHMEAATRVNELMMDFLRLAD